MTFIFPRNYLTGLQWSTAGSSASFTVTAGQAADSTNAAIMNFPAAMIKTVSGWSAGSGNGGLDTGTIANGTWYYFYLIMRLDTGATDICYSTVATGPVIGANIPSAYIYFRYLGAMKTNGSLQWSMVRQFGDQFLWDVFQKDVFGDTTLGSVDKNYTLASIPPGVTIAAQLLFYAINGVSNNVFFGLYSPVIAAVTTFSANFQLSCPVAGQTQVAPLSIETGNGQVVALAASSANNTIYITTVGWIDRRGQDG